MDAAMFDNRRAPCGAYLGAWSSEDAQWRALFAALDKDCNGYVDKTELRQTMFEVGLELSENDIDTMMKAAGVSIKNRIFYEDFVGMMTGKIGQSQRKAIKVTRESGSLREPSAYSLCDAGTTDYQPDATLQAIRVTFAMFDKDGDGLISVQEALDTMTSLGIKISLKEVKEIFLRVDTDRDGFVNFAEFRQLIMKHQAVADKDARLQSAKKSSRVGQDQDIDQELKDAFQIFDKDQDGFLNAYDLRSTMTQLGLILSEEDIHAMMKSVGIGPHGKISYPDFCRIYNTSEVTDEEEGRIKASLTNNKLTKRQESELRAVFKVFDMDHDGFITIDEVIKVLESMGFIWSQACIEEIFRQVDLDGNGKIDFREFLLLVHNYERPLPEDVEMREMFNALDKDRNGFIDRDELKLSFGELGIRLTNADVQAMMSEAEVKTDRIYFEDFVYMMTGKLRVTSSEKRLSIAAPQPLQHSLSHQLPLTKQTVTTTTPYRASADNVASQVATDDSTVKACHHDRVAILAEARRKRESATTHHRGANGSVHKAIETPTHQRHANNISSGLSFEVQEFFRESTSADTLRVTPSSEPCVELNANETTTSAKVPNTWLAFKVFDRNSDGYISKLELHKTMIDLGIPLSREDLDVMMLEADINKDGRIDYSEFSKLMKGSFESFANQAAFRHQKGQKGHSTGTVNYAGNGKITSGTGSTPARRSSASVVGTASSPVRRRPPPPPPNTRPPPVPPRPAPGTFTFPPGSVTSTEAAPVAMIGLGFAAEEEMRAAFQVFDLDGDGLIDHNELQLTMRNLGETLTERDVDAMIQAVDMNDDGKIDYEEFILMLKGSK